MSPARVSVTSSGGTASYTERMMSDVLLIFSPDKETVGNRIAEAIGSAGFTTDSKRVSALNCLTETLEKSPAAPATLLLWSRQLVSSARDAGMLDRIRCDPSLIEVSADGIEPVE